METMTRKLLGLALAGMALAAAQGCAASSPAPVAMQMSADVTPPAAPGRTAEAVTMPDWVKLYGRSLRGGRVLVLRGGIESVRVRTSTILVYEDIGGAKSSWKIVVYDAPTGSLLESTPETNSPTIVSTGVKKNADGSVVLRFGPTPRPGMENNWIRTSSEIPW